MPERVVIIGAGLAGLTAACSLKECGVKAVVLEARSTAGGRVRTVREPFDDGLFVELGGEHVPDIHYRLRHYLRRFQIQTVALNNPPLQKIIWFRGKRVFVKPECPVRWPQGIPGIVDGKAPGDIEAAFTTLVSPEIGDPEVPGWPQAEALRYDHMTMGEFLLSRGATRDQLELFKIGLNSLDGDSFESNSALFSLIGGISFRGYQSSGFVQGGTDSLPRAMAACLRDEIKFRTAVRGIEANGKFFDVFYDEGDSTERLRCEHLIVAIPFAVLRTIRITPALPSAKRRAIDNLPNTSVTRTFLQFKERVWEEVGLSGYADTDQVIMSVYPGEPGASQRGILESYTAGPIARNLAKWPINKRIEHTLEHLNRLFPGISKCYERGLSFSWDEDPWARGAYAYYRAGEMDRYYGSVATPVGRMIFAGDHTTPQPGWMESAIQSGERAAGEVMKSLAGQGETPAPALKKPVSKKLVAAIACALVGAAALYPGRITTGEKQ